MFPEYEHRTSYGALVVTSHVTTPYKLSFHYYYYYYLSPLFAKEKVFTVQNIRISMTQNSSDK